MNYDISKRSIVMNINFQWLFSSYCDITKGMILANYDIQTKRVYLGINLELQLASKIVVPSNEFRAPVGLQSRRTLLITNELPLPQILSQ